MLAWMVYLTVVSLVLSLTALIGEHTARMWRLPRRWLWSGAIAGSALLAIVPWGIPPSGSIVASGTAGPIAATLSEIGPARFGATILADRERLQRLDEPLWIGWLLLSVGTLAAVAASARRVGRERAGWSERDVNGSRVLMSDRVGPAVVGFVRPAIVLPRWVLQSSEEERRLILAHEHEHVRAGDQRLVAMALLAVVFAPWNLAFWWQLRRLRQAIELDCDQRVLKRGANVARYGALLLATSRRPSFGFGYGSPFGEPAVYLERRIAAMVAKTPRFRAIRGVLSASLSVVLLVSACQVDRPSSPANLMDVRPAPRAASDGIVVSHDEGGTVAGRVLYEDNGEPVVGAAVVVEHTARGMIVRDDGSFSITRVPAGARVVVAVRHLDEKRQAIKDGWKVSEPVNIEPGRTTHVNIRIARPGVGPR
jgi:bla regulator protein blaR1